MSKLTSRILFSFILIVTFSGMALARPTHMVGSTRPLSLVAGAGGPHFGVFAGGNAGFAWTEGAPGAFAHALVTVAPALSYEFMLVSTTSSDGDSITGRWNVKKNGMLVCTNCIGKAYGLSGPIGNAFKIYVGTRAVYAENWHYSGYITSRFDF